MPEGFYPASRFSGIYKLDSGQKPAGMTDFWTFAKGSDEMAFTIHTTGTRYVHNSKDSRRSRTTAFGLHPVPRFASGQIQQTGETLADQYSRRAWNRLQRLSRRRSDGCRRGDEPHQRFSRRTGTMAIPSLCGRCHIGVTRYYMNSAHGRTLGRGGPTCVICHGSHGIKSASLDLVSKKYCSSCHTFEKTRMIRSAMLKRDTMLMAIEKKIKILKRQGGETDQLEKRLFALRNRFHAMFHSLDIKLIIMESEHIQAELEKTNGSGGAGTTPLTGALAVGSALLAALLFYMIKKNLD